MPSPLQHNCSLFPDTNETVEVPTLAARFATLPSLLGAPVFPYIAAALLLVAMLKHYFFPAVRVQSANFGNSSVFCWNIKIGSIREAFRERSSVWPFSFGCDEIAMTLYWRRAGPWRGIKLLTMFIPLSRSRVRTFNGVGSFFFIFFLTSDNRGWLQPLRPYPP